MAFVVLEESSTVRHLLCYMLLSLGIKGIPVETRAQAEKEFVSRTDIDGILVDIDNKAADGEPFIKTLKGDPKTKDLPVIVHTIQTQKEVVTALAELGVAGILTKPFHEAESFAKLKNILAHISGPRENQRRHVRVMPPADELLRLNFRVSGHPGLLSAKIRNISMGGAGVELMTPISAGLLKPDTFIERLQFTLLGRELVPAGVIVVVQGKIVGIRWTTLSSEDSLNLARYIFDTMSS